jgi:long-chain acyl-CoA synthetase
VSIRGHSREQKQVSNSGGILSGERLRSKAQLDERIRRIAGGLQRLGVAQGDCVAILMRNDIPFLEATYGTMMLGAYAVPINWHFKPDEIEYVLRDCGAKVLIGHADLLQVPLQMPRQVKVLCAATPPDIATAYGLDASSLPTPDDLTDFESWLADQSLHDGPPVPQPQSIIYTSGTTGSPKGVRRYAPTAEQEAAAVAMRALVYGIKPGARALIPGPLYHSAPNAFAVRAGRMVELLVLTARFDPEGLLTLIERERIDTMFMVPTMFIRLMKLSEAVRQRYDVSSLRHVIHAAAPCPPNVKKAMIDWWGPVIYEFYGGTETGAVTFATSEDAIRKPGTVGKITPGAELKILDDDGRELPPGAVGEIFSRISSYPDFTYHNMPEKRAEVERDGLITCGDVGYIDADGYVFICDRKRDMVISGGVNIYPAEIETILHALPGVHDCAVFGVPDEEFGEALMAVVEPQPDAILDPAVLRRELAHHLADYKVPKHIELRTGLPREDSGKIFKRHLRDPYWEKAGRRI